jgi:hypothetical protein
VTHNADIGITPIWTKHEKRLARDFGRIRFGDEGYAREELVALS